MTPQEILALSMEDNDAKASTIRDYLVSIVAKVWKEGESFGGKRPFGNSGWEHELYKPLIKANLIDGRFDEDGYLEDCDSDAGDRLIAEAIEYLRKPNA